MSTPEFKRNVVEPILKSLDAAYRKKFKEDVKAHEGQLFIFDTTPLEIELRNGGLNDSDIKGLIDNLREGFENAEKTLESKNPNRVAYIRNFAKKEGITNYYIVTKYETVASLKSKLVSKATRLGYGDLNKLKNIGKAVHIGHGDLGVAVAGAGALDIAGQLTSAQVPDSVRKEFQEKIIDKIFGSKGFQNLVSRKSTEEIYITAEHTQVISGPGTLHKDYTFILNFQDAVSNYRDADLEQKWFGEIRDILTKDLPNLKSSMSLKDAIESNLLSQLGGKVKNPRVPPKRVHNSKNTVKSTLKVKNEVKVAKAGAPERIRFNNVRTGPPINLVALINAKLPEEIRKRMTYPRLQWRTGRFAGSVRALSAEGTRNGGVTVGYTYQRNPYELFEPGRSSLATPARDPKQLIDLSIRAIAQQYVQGRFYTRRM